MLYRSDPVFTVTFTLRSFKRATRSFSRSRANAVFAGADVRDFADAG
jgi:hypothetical protein